ncbi:MAG: hypothetical protein ABRQ23_01825 [Syntrophomonadaceae bacterium]
MFKKISRKLTLGLMVVAMSLCLVVPVAFAPPPPNTMVLSDYSTITLEFVSQGAAWNSGFGLTSPSSTGVLGYSGSATPGTSYSLGTYPAGTEIIAFISGAEYGTWDSKNIAQAKVIVESAQTWRVEFEDMAGGDNDFNDVILRITGIPQPPVDVGIDIKPFSCPNAINLGNKGTLPVAIFGYPGFLDVMDIDPGSVELGGVPLAVKKNGNLFFAYEDNNGDGIMDMICHFSMPELTGGTLPALDADTDLLVLTAELYDGTPISGEDTPWVVPIP